MENSNGFVVGILTVGLGGLAFLVGTQFLAKPVPAKPQVSLSVPGEPTATTSEATKDENRETANQEEPTSVSSSQSKSASPIQEKSDSPVVMLKETPKSISKQVLQPASKTTPKAKSAARPVIIKEIDNPGPKPTKENNWGSINFNPLEYFYLSPDASRLITISKKESICWDTKTGKQISSFHSAMDPRFYISPDAKTFVQLQDKGDMVAYGSTETGKILGTYSVPKLSMMNPGSFKPGFTPCGDYFVFCEYEHTDKRKGYRNFHAVNLRTGVGKVWCSSVDLSDDTYDLQHQCLQPIPNSSSVLLYFSDTLGGILPGRVCSVDTKTGKVRGFPEITAKPSHFYHTPGYDFQLSWDGKLLMVKDYWGDVQIADPKTGKLVWEKKKPHTSRTSANLTPDNRRLITLENFYFLLYNLGEEEEIASWCWKDIISISPLTSIKRFTISQDGKTVAVLCPHKVYLLDFQAMFDVAPLPAVKVGKETLN